MACGRPPCLPPRTPDPGTGAFRKEPPALIGLPDDTARRVRLRSTERCPPLRSPSRVVVVASDASMPNCSGTTSSWTVQSAAQRNELRNGGSIFSCAS